jgi:hypothetical protein
MTWLVLIGGVVVVLGAVVFAVFWAFGGGNKDD